MTSNIIMESQYTRFIAQPSSNKMQSNLILLITFYRNTIWVLSPKIGCLILHMLVATCMQDVFFQGQLLYISIPVNKGLKSRRKATCSMFSCNACRSWIIRCKIQTLGAQQLGSPARLVVPNCAVLHDHHPLIYYAEVLHNLCHRTD